MSPPRNSAAYQTFLLSLLALTCSASSVEATSSSLPSFQFQRRQDGSNVPCGFEGDKDTYGLGIRLGLYCQWLTTSLANNFVPEEAVTMRGVNNAFQLSTFISLIYITITKRATRDLFAVECLIVIVFGLGGSCSGRGKGNASSAMEKVQTGLTDKGSVTVGQLIRLILSTALAYYLVWFVFLGMDQMAHPECSRTVFFFAKVDLYHRFRTFLKVVSVVFALGTGTWILGSMYGIVKLSRSLRGKKLLGAIFAFSEDQSGPASHETVINNTSFSLELVLFILFVELTIRWSHINGINALDSTGQLLPFIVGASSLIRTVYKAIYKKYRGDYRRSSNYSLGGPVIDSDSTGDHKINETSSYDLGTVV